MLVGIDAYSRDARHTAARFAGSVDGGSPDNHSEAAAQASVNATRLLAGDQAGKGAQALPRVAGDT